MIISMECADPPTMKNSMDIINFLNDGFPKRSPHNYQLLLAVFTATWTAQFTILAFVSAELGLSVLSSTLATGCCLDSVSSKSVLVWV